MLFVSLLFVAVINPYSFLIQKFYFEYKSSIAQQKLINVEHQVLLEQVDILITCYKYYTMYNHYL